PLKLSSRPAWPAGLVARSTSNNQVLDSVLASAGARPMDRDPVDARIVRQVRERSGQIINCVAADGSARCQKNAGGWPVLAENRRTLTLPENPDAMNSDGYTNLEKWLHRMAAAVERRGVIAAPKATLD